MSAPCDKSDHFIKQLEADYAFVYTVKPHTKKTSQQEDQRLDRRKTEIPYVLFMYDEQQDQENCQMLARATRLLSMGFDRMKHTMSLLFYRKCDQAASSATWNAKLARKTMAAFATSFFDLYTSQHLVIRAITS